MLDGFLPFEVIHQGVRLHARVGGRDGAKPLLLIHGHPQTHVMWHLVAPDLAKHFRVVLFDLRGCGDSDRPAPTSDHLSYSKRVMALDAMAVMQHLGFSRFQVLAHDRGARVAHRLAADFPDCIERMMLLDIAPTLGMYQNTSQLFATLYWHWFFLIQPPPLPERLVGNDPVHYLHSVMGAHHGGLKKFSVEALREYERCALIEGSAIAMIEGYRASATIDLEHDRADVDSGRLLEVPTHVLWGEKGALERCFNVLELWRQRIKQVSGTTIDCGHYMAEENPQLVLTHAMQFLMA